MGSLNAVKGKFASRAVGSSARTESSQATRFPASCQYRPQARPREHDTSHADAAGGTPERHPELPGNTASREFPPPFALVSEDTTAGGDATAR